MEKERGKAQCRLALNMVHELDRVSQDDLCYLGVANGMQYSLSLKSLIPSQAGVCGPWKCDLVQELQSLDRHVR